MNVLLGIDWWVTSELISGRPTPNKYGLLFVTGLIIGYFVMKRVFKKENISETVLDKLLMYVVLGTIIGARLGHVFFYGPYKDGFNAETGYYERGYFSHPEDIFKIWEGGLASHGAAIAILIALWIFSKRISHKPMMWILDRIAAPIAIAACFIRLGNLVNHEIIGDPTSLPWGFRFNYAGAEYLINGVQVFRHPAQLYESILYLLIFLFLLFLYWKKDAGQRPGRLFGWFMILLWSARFLVEFIKVGQTQRDSILFFNTGQLLSIPLILAGVIILRRSYKKGQS